MKKASAVFMTAICIMLFSSASAAKERTGANIIVTKNDGSQLNGELIAVKKDSLLLLVGGPSAGVAHSIAWETITKIVIVRHSKVVQGMAIGGLLLGVGGALIGYACGDDPPGWISFTADQKAAFFGTTLALVGIIVGGVSGASAGADVSLPVDAASAGRLLSVQARLAQMARVKAIQ